MVSILNLIKCLVILTLFLCSQLHASPINDDDREMTDVDFDEILQELLPSQQERLYHQLDRRASLRYHPHILYKKASLKPFIGQNGKIIFSARDRD